MKYDVVILGAGSAGCVLAARQTEDPTRSVLLLEAVRFCVRTLEHQDYRGIVESWIEPTDADLNSDEALDQWLLGNVSTSQHISCTCKMGPDSDPMAVVDQRERVRGLQALRVVDASIMPNCIRANTTSTTLMIAERIADWMNQGVGCKAPVRLHGPLQRREGVESTVWTYSRRIDWTDIHPL